MQNKLFKKSSMDRISSPEKLNDYIQVSGISSWMVLTAALVLLLGMLTWGFFGEMTERESFTGVVRDGRLQCYVSSLVSSALDEGMEVTLSPMMEQETAVIIPGRVAVIADTPLSYEEASEGIDSDYLTAVLSISSWNIVVEIEPQEQLNDGMVYTVSAVTDVQRPIDLLFQ